MFSLPQSPHSSLLDSNDRHIVALSEDSRTIEMMLKFCYPFEDPDLSTFADVQNMLEVTTKYDIPCALKNVRECLIRPAFLNSEPLRVFAVAYRYKLEKEVRLAAKYTLRHPFPGESCFEELEHLSARAYHWFLMYREECKVVSISITHSLEWMKTGCWMWNYCRHLDFPRDSLVVGGSLVEVPAWFVEYLQELRSDLDQWPLAPIITHPRLMEASLKKAGQCATCREKSFTNLSDFATSCLGPEIDKAISEIVLDLEF